MKLNLDNISEDWILQNIKKKDGILYAIFKNVIDVLFGFIGLLFFLLLLPFIALCIKLDSQGKILFSQERFGKNRKKFFLYKFRTLRSAPGEQQELWREKNKHNITTVGNILRRTHLDELPQFINLLRGDISFIGPRAEWSKLAEDFEKQIPFYSYRYVVRPGIIGWAQINFPPSRSVQEAKEKFEFDLYYIKHRSFLLDLEILVKAFRLFRW